MTEAREVLLTELSEGNAWDTASALDDAAVEEETLDEWRNGRDRILPVLRVTREEYSFKVWRVTVTFLPALSPLS